jgi:tripartite-type tricarboxylate transporter receptor subunit TctC
VLEFRFFPAQGNMEVCMTSGGKFLTVRNHGTTVAMRFAFRYLLAAGLAAAAGTVAAQAYPAKPVRILVPFAAGGVADITARVLAQKMGDTIGQQVLVENRPSAGGILASEAVAKADPDGYTLLFITNGNAISATLFRSLPYDTVNDFAAVSTVGFFDLVVVVNSDSKIGSLKELIQFAKANPGRLNIGTINIGSTQNLAAELFKAMAGVDAQVVPFKATPAVVTALRSNDVHVAFEILAPVLAQIKGGAVKPLAITSSRRFAGLPEVPTVAEAGIPGYQASSWNGVAAPAKTPRAVIDKLNKEVNAAVAAPEVKQRLQDLGVDARAGTPEQLHELLVSEIAKWRGVIERAKIEKQ